MTVKKWPKLQNKTALMNVANQMAILQYEILIGLVKFSEPINELRGRRQGQTCSISNSFISMPFVLGVVFHHKML